MNSTEFKVFSLFNTIYQASNMILKYGIKIFRKHLRNTKLMMSKHNNIITIKLTIKWYKVIPILLLITFYEWSIESLSEPFNAKTVIILKYQWEKWPLKLMFPKISQLVSIGSASKTGVCDGYTHPVHIVQWHLSLITCQLRRHKAWMLKYSQF